MLYMAVMPVYLSPSIGAQITEKFPFQFDKGDVHYLYGPEHYLRGQRLCSHSRTSQPKYLFNISITPQFSTSCETHIKYFIYIHCLQYNNINIEYILITFNSIRPKSNSLLKNNHKINYLDITAKIYITN
jgi:hypothetical protein